MKSEYIRQIGYYSTTIVGILAVGRYVLKPVFDSFVDNHQTRIKEIEAG